MIGGEARKALVHFNKNGFAYTLDRATGEVLVAEPYVHVNWAKRVDLATGRPVLDSTKLTGASKGKVKEICPSLEGGKSPASPASYSPHTGLFYVSTNNFCMDWQSARDGLHSAARPTSGPTFPYRPVAGGNLGAFIAWDAVAGKKVWEIQEKFPVWSGALATAGDVVFYGTLDGWFKAADAKTGKPLWKFKVGSGVVGEPITYRGPDGKQYVAVYAGHRRRLVPDLGRCALRRSGGRAAARGLHAGPGPVHEPGRDRVDLRAVSSMGHVMLAVLTARRHRVGRRTRESCFRERQGRQGGLLFSSMNCDGCHGAGALGFVGPNLVDGRWRLVAMTQRSTSRSSMAARRGCPPTGPCFPTALSGSW